jgi:hypothetical protein
MISLFCFWPRAWVYYKRNFEVWKESGWMERRGEEERQWMNGHEAMHGVPTSILIHFDAYLVALVIMLRMQDEVIGENDKYLNVLSHCLFSCLQFSLSPISTVSNFPTSIKRFDLVRFSASFLLILIHNFTLLHFTK